MNEEYIIIQEESATYLCRKTEYGCEVLAQKGSDKVHRPATKGWVRYKFRLQCKWTKKNFSPPPAGVCYVEEPEYSPISKEEATAIMLIGKRL